MLTEEDLSAINDIITTALSKFASNKMNGKLTERTKPESDESKALRRIKAAGKDGIQRQWLLRRTKCNASRLDRAVEALILQGRIYSVVEEGEGRHPVKYIATDRPKVTEPT